MTTAERQHCAHVCTTEVPPANWVGNLIPASRRYDNTAAHQSIAELSDHYAWRTSHADASTQYGNRHQNYQGNTPHLWDVNLKKEEDHRCWRTTIHAVMDDFGWLVEVPTC
jgi:hypothetical protein